MRANFLQSRWWLGTAAAVVGIVVLTANAKEPNKDQSGKKPAVKEEAVVKTAAVAKSKSEAAPSGRELFTREWMANDSRAHGGDGLGPVFNDSSCVACHNLGGIGGGGPASKNVDIISGSFETFAQVEPMPPSTLPEALFHSLFGGLAPRPPAQPVATVPPAPTPEQIKSQKKLEKDELVKVHPGFASARSVVLHHFGIDPKYQEWRMNIVNGGGGAGPQGGGGGSGLFGGNSQSAIVQAVANAQPAANPAAPEAPAAQPEQPQAEATVVEAPAPEAPPAVGPVDQEPSALVQIVNELSESVSQQSDGSVTPGLNDIQEISILQSEVQNARGGLLNNSIQVGQGSEFGSAQVSRSQRNATALFGVGKIDSIPEKVILELAKQEQKEFPDVAGRPSKQKDGKIGRFGWKAQKPSLEDFTLTACAVELGLNVPEHEQAGLALDPKYKAPGLDMDKAECDALVKFLRDLPAPGQHQQTGAKEAAFVDAGRKQFAAIGCTNCHVQKVGTVDGIYSDLLLHDMGPELGDTGNYGVFTPNSPEEEQDDPIPLAIQNQPGVFAGSGIGPQTQSQAPQQVKLTPEQLAKVVGAMRQEWRTPPLWGVRDSGPYLHDGRADTLEQALAFHGGQGAPSAIKFFKLKPEERQQVIAFLKSLTAPDQSLVAVK